MGQPVKDLVFLWDNLFIPSEIVSFAFCSPLVDNQINAIKPYYVTGYCNRNTLARWFSTLAVYQQIRQVTCKCRFIIFFVFLVTGSFSILLSVVLRSSFFELITIHNNNKGKILAKIGSLEL